MTYPFDPDVRKRVTEALYALLPALYRVRDIPEGTTKLLGKPEDGEFYRSLRILAAPLAETRQNIEELYADLFIDTSADWVLPYLAEMVGTRLVFPDAPSNRRDVRGTVGWRRRKGTPSMLEEMGIDLSGHAVTLKEGWKLVLLSQDLDIVRPERTVVAYEPPTVAEQGSGPLDVLSHAIDPRRIGPSVPGTGKYHPKHLAYYTFPTELFPLVRSEPVERTQVGDPDLRYVFHPLNHEQDLRVRRSDPAATVTAAAGDRFASDRVPPMHFAAMPGNYFDQTGLSTTRFCVRNLGLPMGVAEPMSEERSASRRPASRAFASNVVTVRVLEHPTEKWQSAVDIEVLEVPHAAGVPNIAGAEVRGGVRMDAATATSIAGSATAIAGTTVAMLRLKPFGASAAYFPGATIEVAGSAVDARLDSEHVALSALGFLRGAFVIQVPAGWIFKASLGPTPGEKYVYIAADGGITDAEGPPPGLNQPPSIVPLISDGSGGFLLPGALLTSGPGPAWPPLPPTASLDRWTALPCAEGLGPVVVHGAPALEKTGPAYDPAPGGLTMAVVFAARAGNVVEPFLRLDITGADPTSATSCSVLSAAGTVVPGAAARGRLAAISQFAFDHRDQVEMLVRLETNLPDIVLPPCEVAFTDQVGRSFLIYLPTLSTQNPGGPTWPLSLAERSTAVVVAADGATYLPASPQVLRYAFGPIAPIRSAVSLLRRRVRQRSLCPWKNESPGKQLPATLPGYLDIDPHAGLFSLAPSEPPVLPTSVVSGLTPAPAVTVDMQEGYSAHTGARPDARAPWLDAAPPAPTRIVLRNGYHQKAANNNWYTTPVYSSLKDALDAIAAAATPANHEVIEIQDSATYVESNLTWPDKPISLTLQAAERERPVVVLKTDFTAGPASYKSLAITGILFAQGPQHVHIPPAAQTTIAFVTVDHPAALWRFAAGTFKQSNIVLNRSIFGRLQFQGELHISVLDSIIDARAAAGIDAFDSTLRIERSTVVVEGFTEGVKVLVLEASESLFETRVTALDRFRGCIRYCRVNPNSQLPRRHRVVFDLPMFVSRDRLNPAHLRLSERCPQALLKGAEDGAEIGAFHDVRLGQRTEALVRRLLEYTPAGLVTGLVRMD
ncbi:MAG: hypothetical protein IPK82_35770 [Polyangiaceae bacterium]|nr:hypothetical protein [Polyangiaceae bacterium]